MNEYGPGIMMVGIIAGPILGIVGLLLGMIFYGLWKKFQKGVDSWRRLP